MTNSEINPITTSKLQITLITNASNPMISLAGTNLTKLDHFNFLYDPNDMVLDDDITLTITNGTETHTITVHPTYKCNVNCNYD